MLRRKVLRIALAPAALLGVPLPAAPSSDALAGTALPASPYPPALPGTTLRFPRDFGAHPAYRTEWWYLTGWLRAQGRELGVQLTFFRSRTRHDEANPSRFAPTQLVFAHAALAIDGERRLRHAQRAARAGFGLASASQQDTDLKLGDWRLRRSPADRYLARIDTDDFALDLAFSPEAAPFLQGDRGFSRKGPRPKQASHYYSRPRLRVSGRLRIGAAQGKDAPGWIPIEPGSLAWLDHEWSSEILDSEAQGWDWVGLNLDDGSALMAFRIRRRDGGVLWSHARWAGSPQAAAAPRFKPLRHWRSARSGASYPVSMRVTVGARELRLEPIFDDQELDTRGSTGTIYWEGAVRVFEQQRQVGRGYLELTGYAGGLRL